MARALVKNAADEEQVKKGKSQEDSLRDQQLNDLRYVLNDERGRRFIWRLLGECGVYQTSFTGNSTTFFNEGKRQIGLFTLGEVMEASIEAYLKMQHEAKGDD